MELELIDVRIAMEAGQQLIVILKDHVDLWVYQQPTRFETANDAQRFFNTHCDGSVRVITDPEIFEVHKEAGIFPYGDKMTPSLYAKMWRTNVIREAPPFDEFAKVCNECVIYECNTRPIGSPRSYRNVFDCVNICGVSFVHVYPPSYCEHNIFRTLLGTDYKDPGYVNIDVILSTKNAIEMAEHYGGDTVVCECEYSDPPNNHYIQFKGDKCFETGIRYAYDRTFTDMWNHIFFREG